MKLTRLQINRFRNIDSFSSDIGDGIVLLKGPNEAGKSSLLSAILFGLFEDPRSSAQRLEEAREWNRETLYHISVGFETNGQSYLLEKDFENRSTLLRNEATGESWKDKNKVTAKLTEIIGFFSRDVFTSTACVFQDELNAIHSGQKELRTLLEEKVAGKEESAVEPVLKLLEKKGSDLKRGLDRPAPTNPGQIRQVIDESNSLRQRRDEIASRVLALHQARGRIHEVSNQLGEDLKSLELKKQALEKSKLYIKAKERFETLDKALGKTDVDLEKLQKADREIQGLTTQLDVKQGDLKTGEGNLEKYRKAAKTLTDRDALQKTLQDKKDVLAKVREIVRAIDGLRKSLADLPAIPDKSLRGALRAENETMTLEKAIGQRAMHLKVIFKKKVPYAIETEDGLLSAGEGAAGERVEGIAKKEIRIDLKEIAEVQVTTQDRALEEGLRELREKKSFLKNQLEQYKCASVAEMEAMRGRWEKIGRDLETKETELKITLGRETLESLTTQVGQLETRLRELGSSFEGIKDFSISEEELANREREIQVLRKHAQELEGNIRENQGILKSFSKEQLEKEKKDLARQMFMAETALDDLKAFEASGQEVLKQEDEVKALERKLSDLKVEQQTLKRILEEERFGQEDVAELEERIEFLERNAERLRMKLKAFEIIGEVLAEARQNVLRGISGEVDERIGAYFARITDKKYEQVRLSREDFSLEVLSSDKGNWINPDTEDLSAGARDQLYLAARLALVDVVTGGNPLPLILDDPLVHFDPFRRENTRNLLKEVSKRHQVVLLSCHDYYDDWADQIISF
ncbi:MAG: AAA family ATPase [Thermodesulfobacteriota bacterium]